MIGRRINWRWVVKYAWVMANLSIWLLGLGSCATEPSCFFAQNNVFPFMILLSFPSGFIFFILVGPFIDVYPSIDYSLLCLGTFAVGYIQWFHTVPALFGKPDITLLRLNQQNQVDAGKIELAANRCKSVKLRPPRILPFDKAGRTPLERAINLKQRGGPTNASGKT